MCNDVWCVLKSVITFVTFDKKRQTGKKKENEDKTKKSHGEGWFKKIKVTIKKNI